MYKSFIFIFFLIIYSKISYSETLAKLRAIDRTTGRSFILKTPLNQTIQFSQLSINVRYCYQNPINMEIENYAYITIKDSQKNLATIMKK